MAVGKGRYPQPFLRAVDQCLALRPENRLQSVADLRRALIESRPGGSTGKLPGTNVPGQNWLMLASAGGALLLLSAVSTAALADEQQVIRTGEPIVGKVERETYGGQPDAWVSTTKMPLRDDRGNILEQAFFGLDGQPKLAKGGYAKVTQAFDDRGNVVEVITFGLDGRWIVDQDGYARMTLAYDDKGNPVYKKDKAGNVLYFDSSIRTATTAGFGGRESPSYSPLPNSGRRRHRGPAAAVVGLVCGRGRH